MSTANYDALMPLHICPHVDAANDFSPDKKKACLVSTVRKDTRKLLPCTRHFFEFNLPTHIFSVQTDGYSL